MMRTKNWGIFCVVLMSFFSCKKEIIATIPANFYHWKINANLNKIEKEALKTAKTETVFLHYFDVVKSGYNEKPVAVLREVGEELKNVTIVPVIFIRNSVFKNGYSYTEYLANKVLELTEQIHQHHFKNKPKEIQIDCDWTESTKEKYFEFLRALRKKIKVSVTIRLHQLKYANRTGIPPVDYGSLMLYNVGDLKNKEENSILKESIVSTYINHNTTYPLALDLALPIFSQVVLINNKGDVKLINQANFNDFKTDTEHFKKVTETLYIVTKKILYKGQYLYKGFTIKLEESTIDEIVKSYESIKNSKLNINSTILYHLDDTSLEDFNLTALLQQLK